MKRIGPRVGINPDTLRGWCKQADIDAGRAPGVRTADGGRIKELEREVRPGKDTQPVTSIPDPLRRRIVVGVDTHKNVHVAVALDQVGALIGDTRMPVDRAGYAQLERWAGELGEQVDFGVEGSGSYGAGLVSFLRRRGHCVLEVNRPDRRIRHLRGKNDTIDAETAARAVLSGAVTAVPKSADGTVEMIRQVKIAKDTAVKARSQAIVTLKTVIVTAPAELREKLALLGDKALLAESRKFRYESMSGPADAACYTLRTLADRYPALDQEARLHDRVLATLTDRAAPALIRLFGVGEDCAAELLLVVGDNPERIRSEAALAKLCGACPIPASSGKTSRHRLNRGGHRPANAALHRILVVRMRFHEPTIAYVNRRTAEGKTKKEILRCLKRLVGRVRRRRSSPPPTYDSTDGLPGLTASRVPRPGLGDGRRVERYKIV